MRLLVVERRQRKGGLAFPVELDAYEPRLTTDFTVLDILLGSATARIDGQLTRLAAIWAANLSHVVELGTKIALERAVRFKIVKVHATRCDPIPPSASFL